jgi:outer membrane protein assembly factor BamB
LTQNDYEKSLERTHSLHAVNAGGGQRVWRFEPAHEAPAPGTDASAYVQPQSKIRANAIVNGPHVIFGSLDEHVYMIDRQTGKQVWKKNTRGPVTSSPFLMGDKLIIGNRNGLMAALNPATGEVVWRLLFWGSSVESDAVPYDGLFYVGSSDLRRISLIDPKDGRVIWRTDVYGWAGRARL